MPKQYLITLSIGPVQDFIAAARRTRDLWFGSYVLSEVSKAAALSFKNSGAQLIFPAPQTNLLPDNKGYDSKDNVGNKLMVLADTDAPEAVVKIAKAAAQTRWETLAAQAKKEIKVEDSIWSEQVTDVLEFFSAWVYLENASDYGAPEEQNKGRKRLEKLLNARKNTREFKPNHVQGDSIAKSSLDGLRESVLLPSIRAWEKRKLGLSAGEELDCIGVVKRLGGPKDQFTPLSRLAIDPWLRNPKVRKLLSEKQPAIDDIFTQINKANLGLVSPVKGNGKIYDFFPFDGQLFYDFRIQAEKASLDKLAKKADQEADQEATKNIEAAQSLLLNLKDHMALQPFKDLPKPTPYMAILAADGDRMGELLGNMDSIVGHQKISAKLGEFASNVAATIRNYRGHCIYAGGDDVLALLPLDKAIDCARRLAADFYAKLAEIDSIDPKCIPTLSVGLGISHFLTPLSRQLELARRAEQLAKSNDKPLGESKNALAILLQPRSGAEISFRERWDNDIPPAELLGKWISAHNGNLLPSRFGYELREMSFALGWCQDQSFIEKEVSRILERKRNLDGSFVDDGLIATICRRAAKIGPAKLADELIITRRIAEAHKLSEKPAPGTNHDG